MVFSGQTFLIVGMGKTGIATARFLARRQGKIMVTDQKDINQVVRELYKEGIFPEAVPYDVSALNHVDMVIPSPGVPPHDPILAEAVRRGIPLCSELEIACRFLKTPLIAITGTNGKTTTTTLVGNILAASGYRVFVGGNIGNPLIEYCDMDREDDYAVAEVSSFQLQWVRDFHAHGAALLNMTWDHVDYHGSFAAYQEAKKRVFGHQGPDDWAIFNACHEPEMGRQLKSQTLFFSSTEKAVTRGAFLRGGDIVLTGMYGDDEIYPVDMVKIPGRHNIENVMVAVLIGRMCHCPRERIVEAVSRFRGISHRIEFVREKDGVTYYDDSKGTNVDAVVRALETFDRPIILLMGGRDKDGDFAVLKSLIEERVKRLILFGEARDKIKGKIGRLVETDVQATMAEAVLAAYKQARHGDVVLLSPGCASFDEFTDYKNRGNVFQDLVRRM